MVEPHGPAPVQYVPRQETRTVTSAGPSLWLILLAGLVIPGAIAFSLATNEIAYSIAIFLALIGGVAIMAQPFIGLVLFLVLVYCRPEELFPAITGMRLTLIVTAFTLLGAWFHTFIKRERMIRTPAIPFMFGIAAIAPLSTMVKGGETGEAIREVWMLLLLVMMIFALVRTRAKFQAFVTAIIGVTTYLAGYSLYLLYFQDIAYNEKHAGGAKDRVLTEGSIFQDPNDLASALVPGLALVLMRMMQAKGWRKAPYAVIACLLLFATFQTQSRGGFIALIITLAAMVILNSKKKALGLGIAAVLGLGILVMASGRMTTISAEEDSAQSRFQFWDNGLQALRESPIIGIGYNNYNELNYNRQAPHNTYLQLLVELGPIGFFCFMGIFYYAFRKPTAAARDELPTDQDRRDLLGTRISLAGFMIAAFFLSRAYIPCLYIQACLPMVQQISASGRHNVIDVNSKERFRDWLYIAGWCLALVAVVKVLLFKYL